MRDPHFQSLKFHLNDLERAARPSIKEYRKPAGGGPAIARAFMIVALLVATAVVLPMV